MKISVVHVWSQVFFHLCDFSISFIDSFIHSFFLCFCVMLFSISLARSPLLGNSWSIKLSHIHFIDLLRSNFHHCVVALPYRWQLVVIWALNLFQRFAHSECLACACEFYVSWSKDVTWSKINITQCYGIQKQPQWSQFKIISLVLSIFFSHLLLLIRIFLFCFLLSYSLFIVFFFSFLKCYSRISHKWNQKENTHRHSLTHTQEDHSRYGNPNSV